MTPQVGDIWEWKRTKRRFLLAKFIDEKRFEVFSLDDGGYCAIEFSPKLWGWRFVA